MMAIIVIPLSLLLSQISEYFKKDIITIYQIIMHHGMRQMEIVKIMVDI